MASTGVGPGPSTVVSGNSQNLWADHHAQWIWSPAREVQDAGRVTWGSVNGMLRVPACALEWYGAGVWGDDQQSDHSQLVVEGNPAHHLAGFAVQRGDPYDGA